VGGEAAAGTPRPRLLTI